MESNLAPCSQNPIEFEFRCLTLYFSSVESKFGSWESFLTCGRRSASMVSGWILSILRLAQRGGRAQPVCSHRGCHHGRSRGIHGHRQRSNLRRVLCRLVFCGSSSSRMSTSKNGKPRGVSYSDSECVSICRAWVHAKNNPIKVSCMQSFFRHR